MLRACFSRRSASAFSASDRRIEEIDAGIERRPDKAVGLFLLLLADKLPDSALAAKSHRAEANPRDDKPRASEFRVFHGAAFPAASCNEDGLTAQPRQPAGPDNRANSRFKSVMAAAMASTTPLILVKPRVKAPHYPLSGGIGSPYRI